MSGTLDSNDDGFGGGARNKMDSKLWWIWLLVAMFILILILIIGMWKYKKKNQNNEIQEFVITSRVVKNKYNDYEDSRMEGGGDGDMDTTGQLERWAMETNETNMETETGTENGIKNATSILNEIEMQNVNVDGPETNQTKFSNNLMDDIVDPMAAEQNDDSRSSSIGLNDSGSSSIGLNM